MELMPYIKISDPPSKSIIDTGANKLFINIEIAENYFLEFIKRNIHYFLIFQTTTRDFYA